MIALFSKPLEAVRQFWAFFSFVRKLADGRWTTISANGSV
jgi:hypothetical protein